MQFTYDFAGGQAKMICTPDNNEMLDQRVWNQLSVHIENPYLVPIKVEGQGRNVKLIYSLAGLTNLLAWREDASRKEIKMLTEKMEEALQSLGSIIMPQDYMMLDDRYLYMDEKSGNLRIICVPLMDEALAAGFRDEKPIFEERIPEPSFKIHFPEGKPFANEDDVTRGFLGNVSVNNEDDVTRGFLGNVPVNNEDGVTRGFSGNVPVDNEDEVTRAYFPGAEPVREPLREEENKIYRGYGAFGSIGSPEDTAFRKTQGMEQNNSAETVQNRYTTGPSRGAVSFIPQQKTENPDWNPVNPSPVIDNPFSWDPAREGQRTEAVRSPEWDEERTYGWTPAAAEEKAETAESPEEDEERTYGRMPAAAEEKTETAEGPEWDEERIYGRMPAAAEEKTETAESPEWDEERTYGRMPAAAEEKTETAEGPEEDEERTYGWTPAAAEEKTETAEGPEEDEERTYGWTPAAAEEKTETAEGPEEDEEGTFDWTPASAEERIEEVEVLQEDDTLPLNQDIVITAGFSRCKTGEFFEIGKGRIQIGRDAEICLRGNPALNRVHCVIYRDENGFSLEDQGSVNGTWVDGARAKQGNKMKLYNGSRIQLADEKFIFEIF